MLQSDDTIHRNAKNAQHLQVYNIIQNIMQPLLTVCLSKCRLVKLVGLY